MKNYLNEELTQEEKLTILGLIWKVARRYKAKYYVEQKMYNEVIDNLDLITEDEYFSEELLKNNIASLYPLTVEQKYDIILYIDSILKDLGLLELKTALTSNEKLVFFLFYQENYRNGEVALLLNNTEKTIFNRRKSIDTKIKKMKGELRNV